MNHARVMLTLSVTCLSGIGCFAETHEPTEEGSEHTKEEARALSGRSDLGVDICEAEGWYGDGICDDFCVDPDPDCDECAALPSCGDGETEHASSSECPADASCREVTVCGATIWCSSTDAPTCAGDNPQGCLDDTDCDAGETCDLSMSRSSGCYCDPESGTWTCTPDLSAGACVES